jgi:hypothetical protein
MYREVARCDAGEFGQFDRPKRPMRLPTVLTRDEVKRVLVHMEQCVAVHSKRPSIGDRWWVLALRMVSQSFSNLSWSTGNQAYLTAGMPIIAGFGLGGVA